MNRIELGVTNSVFTKLAGGCPCNERAIEGIYNDFAALTQTRQQLKEENDSAAIGLLKQIGNVNQNLQSFSCPKQVGACV